MTDCLDSTRAGRLSAAIDQQFDIAIIGGGIVGACAARDAAMRGYSVLLLEAVDYASQTSSRSSKLLHGGLRYLEQGDLALVHEALLERATLLEIAPHICRPQEAIFPVIPGRTRPAWQIRLGLAMYDALSYDYRTLSRDKRFPAHTVLASNSEEFRKVKDLGLSFSALMTYSDGQTEDTRLVIENIVDASALGAVSLNHAPLRSAKKVGGEWRLEWYDALSSSLHVSRARYVINSAGPWAQSVFDEAFQNKHAGSLLRFSRGVHLLFDVDLPVGALTVATGVPGRIYFVWPHFCPRGKGTLVGTTEREIEKAEFNPEPSDSEISEILGHLRRDFPDSGLDEKAAFRAFCGIRTLVPSATDQTGGSTSKVSRRERFEEMDGAVAIYGGKYTTARHTAECAVDRADKYFDRRLLRSGRMDLRTRPLPGGKDWSAAASEALVEDLICRFASPAGAEVDRQTCRAAVFRLGMRAAALLEPSTESKTPNNSLYLPGEVRYMTSIEHAATADDIIFRRLLLHSSPGELHRHESEIRTHASIEKNRPA